MKTNKLTKWETQIILHSVEHFRKTVEAQAGNTTTHFDEIIAQLKWLEHKIKEKGLLFGKNKNLTTITII